MDAPHVHSGGTDAVAEISLTLDDDTTPFATFRPPATCTLDTTTMEDGPHVLHVRARDGLGLVGVRSIPFHVSNGPGITVTGLHAHERVSGSISLNLNAFSASEPFDPVRAESSGPIPTWTWVMIALIAAWAGWYGLTEFQEPAAYALTAARDPVAAANAPMSAVKPAKESGSGSAAGFDYAASGAVTSSTPQTAPPATARPALRRVPGAFPPLAGDPVVTRRRSGRADPRRAPRPARREDQRDGVCESNCRRSRN